MMSNYDKKAMDKLAKPEGVGKLDPKSPDVGTGMVGSPACGDVFKVQIKVNADGVIEKAVFKVIAVLIRMLGIDVWMCWSYCIFQLCY